MRKFLLSTIAAICGLLAAFFIVGAFLPSDYRVERSTVIDAPPATVFEQVNNLEEYVAWMPWDDEDPNMQITWGQSRVGEGASYSWTGDESTGSMTIAESVPNERVVNSLDFDEMGQAIGYFNLEAVEGQKTRITWGIEGQARNTMDRWFGLVMDGMVGPYFERGLETLKQRVETPQ